MTGLLKLSLGLQASEATPNAQLCSLNPHVGGAQRSLACVLPTQLCALATVEARGGGVRRSADQRRRSCDGHSHNRYQGGW